MADGSKEVGRKVGTGLSRISNGKELVYLVGSKIQELRTRLSPELCKWVGIFRKQRGQLSGRTSSPDVYPGPVICGHLKSHGGVGLELCHILRMALTKQKLDQSGCLSLPYEKQCRNWEI